METFIQPKITGYRQLTADEAALMNEGKALAEQCGAYIAKLRGYVPNDVNEKLESGEIGEYRAGSRLDQRWISIGSTDLQRGFMAVMRGICTADDVLTMASIDFDALRAKRTASVMAVMQKLADECGVTVESLHSNYNANACYCACGTGGPCEHVWDGESWESEDGLEWSSTCSRCGCVSSSNDMRVGP